MRARLSDQRDSFKTDNEDHGQTGRMCIFICLFFRFINNHTESILLHIQIEYGNTEASNYPKICNGVEGLFSQ